MVLPVLTLPNYLFFFCTILDHSFTKLLICLFLKHLFQLKIFCFIRQSFSSVQSLVFFQTHLDCSSFYFLVNLLLNTVVSVECFVEVLRDQTCSSIRPFSPFLSRVYAFIEYSIKAVIILWFKLFGKCIFDNLVSILCLLSFINRIRVPSIQNLFLFLVLPSFLLHFNRVQQILFGLFLSMRELNFLF